MSESSQNDLQKAIQLDNLQLVGMDAEAVERAAEAVEGLEQAVGNDDHDASIQEYMAALLQRSGVRSSESVETPPPEENPQPARKLAQAEKSDGQFNWTQKAAPEQRSDLSTMRELANANARSALKKYSGAQLVNAMYGKLLVAIIAMVFSIVLSLASTEMFSGLFIVSAAAFTVAILWTARYMSLSGVLRQEVLGVEEEVQTPLDRPAFTPQVDVNPLADDSV